MSACVSSVVNRISFVDCTTNSFVADLVFFSAVSI